MSDELILGGSDEAKSQELVNQIFKSDDILNEDVLIGKLRALYNNDEKLIKKAFKYFTKRFSAIATHAQEFKNKLMEKYQYLPLTKIMKKANEFAARYRMTPAEYHLFLNLVKKDNAGKFQKYTFEEQTAMGKALGYEPKKLVSLHYSAEDKKYLDKILEFNKKSQELNMKVKVNSLSYYDCAPYAMTGEFDRRFDDPTKFVPPVIAAMFLPKISMLENRMIMTSIPGIVNSLYNNERIKDYPNYFLYNDIATDKNQAAYSPMTPYNDLYIRSLLQAKLWEAVLQLRNGQYYKFNSDQFNEIISKYPANIFDAPDLLFTQDSGNILRRIMNAFSFNPSVVSVIKSSDKFAFIDNQFVKQKDASDKKLLNVVPIINVRLPTENTDNYSIKLSGNIKTSQWFTKETDYTPVAYEQKILQSEGVLIFYVNRSYNTININSENREAEERLLNRHNVYNSTDIYHPYVNNLPFVFASSQKINNLAIEADDKISVGSASYTLRSVVVAESIKVGDFAIMGDSSAVIIDKEGRYWYYNPRVAGKFNESNGDKLKPVTQATMESAKNLISTNGTIYIYEQDSY